MAPHKARLEKSALKIQKLSHNFAISSKLFGNRQSKFCVKKQRPRNQMIIMITKIITGTENFFIYAIIILTLFLLQFCIIHFMYRFFVTFRFFLYFAYEVSDFLRHLWESRASSIGKILARFTCKI